VCINWRKFSCLPVRQKQPFGTGVSLVIPLPRGWTLWECCYNLFVGVGWDSPEYKKSSGRTNSSLDGRKSRFGVRKWKEEPRFYGDMLTNRMLHSVYFRSISPLKPWTEVRKLKIRLQTNHTARGVLNSIGHMNMTSIHWRKSIILLKKKLNRNPYATQNEGWSRKKLRYNVQWHSYHFTVG
jgi:hypothetical protein